MASDEELHADDILASEVDEAGRALEEYDRGSLVRVICEFEGEPDEVYFAYMRPGDPNPVVDEGYGKEGSRIVCLSRGVYGYPVDTKGFREGVVRCHFWSRGRHQASVFPKFRIRYEPAQLL